ncbi:hypothetical protein D3C81_598210 [compost metagenome]
MGQALADGQAKPRTRHHIGVAIDLVERIENQRLIVLADPFAGVRDLPLQGSALAFAAQQPDPQDHPSGVGELHGVVQQVVEDLADSRGIADNPLRQLRVQAGIQLQAFAAGGGGIALDDFLYQPQRAELARLQHQLARFDFRHVQHIADQLQQGCRGAFDRPQIVALLDVQWRTREQFQGAQHTVQRGADFVAHGCQEQRLGFVGGIGQLPRLLQRLFDLGTGADVAEGAQQHVLALVAGGRAAQVQVAAIGGFKIVGEGRRRASKGLANPAGAQLLALTALAQPLLGQGVFQHHLAIGAAQYAQRHRGGLDHVAAEQLAFDHGLDPVDRRGDETMLQAPDQQPHQADTQQAEQQGAQQLRYQRGEQRLQTDGIHQLPVG